MYTATSLGVASSGYRCSGTTCIGTNADAQRAFLALQTEINRLGRAFGLSKIDVDGKIGPNTVRALVTLADRLTSKLGTGTADDVLSTLLIEIDGRNATTAEDVAAKAEVITAALQRDGMAQAPRSIYLAARNQMNQFINAGFATAPPPSAHGAGATDPYGVVPGGAAPPNGGLPTVPVVYGDQALPSPPASWKVWAAIGGLAAAAVGAVVWFARRGAA